MYDGGLKRFGFGVNHHGSIKPGLILGEGFQTPRLVRTDVRVIGQEPVGLFGHVSCCSSCRIGWSACHVRAIPVAVFRRVQDDRRGGQETVVADPPVLPHGLVVHLAGLARGFHVHAVQGFVGFLAGVNVVDDGLGEVRAPCGDVREFGEASAFDGPGRV